VAPPRPETATRAWSVRGGGRLEIAGVGSRPGLSTTSLSPAPGRRRKMEAALGGLGLWAAKQDGAGAGRPLCEVGISSGLNGEVGCANNVNYDLRWKMPYRMIQWLYEGV
jgi:hypothetical protein